MFDMCDVWNLCNMFFQVAIHTTTTGPAAPQAINAMKEKATAIATMIAVET